MHQLRDSFFSFWQPVKEICFYLWGYITGLMGVTAGIAAKNIDSMNSVIATMSGVLGLAVLITTLLINIRKLRKK